MRMLASTIVMGVLAAGLLIFGYARGQGEATAGLRTGLIMVAQIIPLLLFAFVIAGMVQVLVPQQAISRWVGESSGLRGILIGSLAGGLAPGGPYMSLPIAAGLVKSGAGMGTMVAFLTGWSLWAFGRLPMEVGILGWKLTAVRLTSTLIFPPLAGMIANFFFGQSR
ncbi:permease [bacterium]|nr:permease [bacterium]MBU1071916.1 permease [bacterium]